MGNTIRYALVATGLLISTPVIAQDDTTTSPPGSSGSTTGQSTTGMSTSSTTDQSTTDQSTTYIPTSSTTDTATTDRSSSAPPADGNGLYIALGGGLVLSEPLRTDAGVRAKLDDGYMVLAAVGGRVGPFRAEVEGSYRRATVGTVSGFGLSVSGTGKVSALSAMGNLYLEPSFGLGSVRPYFGGGAGISRFRARDVGAFGTPVGGPTTGFGGISGSKTVFAYQAMAGLSGPVSNNIIASFGYRYFATPGATLDAPVIGRVRVRGLRTHGIEAGLRFAF